MPTHRHIALLVDNYPAARESLQTLIEANGFTAVGARNGGEALARLRDGLACCVIVFDWWLPDMTGGDFVRALHADPALADVPVATCTGDSGIRAEAAALGVTYVLLKPVDPRRLVDLVNHHCPQGPPAPAASN
jgi:CheY-like chemotaxis protein